MKTRIDEAAELIRRGRLVAFPTETVYGLGANALDPAAVERIYQAKRRPAGSPLIVHVASVEQAKELVSEWPEAADKLAEKFWPGPLTLVLPKTHRVPDIVTAGLETVGVRMPHHSVALKLIQEAGVPIAAPSANPFSTLSPTVAEHVRETLDAEVDMILDAGETEVGIESTVISLAGEKPALLRPGIITRDEIEEVIGPVELAPPVEDAAHPAPGMHRKHYSPRTPLLLVNKGVLPDVGRGAYLWIRFPAEAAESIAMPARPRDYASKLYRILHEVDCKGYDWIAVELPPEENRWAGVVDRLRRASS